MNEKRKILNTKTHKYILSKDYNLTFDKRNGFTQRWGRRRQDDPLYAPFGPEIADIEVSTICHGVGKPCSFCYKKNNPKGENMTLDFFKDLINHLPKTITQIAFGIGDIDANPDLFAMMEYARSQHIIPNITINCARMNDRYFDELSRLCGSVAISRYDDKELCYNAVRELHKRNEKLQINIHLLVAEETYERCLETIEEVKDLPIFALVLLKLKRKGTNYHNLSDDKFKNLVKLSMIEDNKKIGFDSCHTPNYIKAASELDLEIDDTVVESCESYLFSIYINVRGISFPCSFCESSYENNKRLIEGIDAKKAWNHPKTIEWRNELLASRKKICGHECTECLLYSKLSL
jgi:MoaA/NifB/PqqE/SkfB family radical SAM enzyme